MLGRVTIPKMIPIVLFFSLILVGCGSGNSPADVVENYIEGVQNNDAKLVWQNSRFDFFDNTLLKEEKEKKFQEYKDEFDKREHKRFKLFTASAKYNIYSVEKNESKSEVFVEIEYPSGKPFKLEKHKTAKKLKIIFEVRNKKGYNYLYDYDWKVIEYNKQFDNNVIMNFVKKNRGKNLNLCYIVCKSAIAYDKDYFNDIKALAKDLLQEISIVENELTESELYKHISISQNEVTDDTRTYSYTPRWNRMDSGDYYYTPGGSSTEVKGSYVSFYVTNLLHCTTVNVSLEIYARTMRREDSSYIYEALQSTNEEYIKNLKPGESRYVSTHFAGKTRIRPKNPNDAFTGILALTGNVLSSAAKLTEPIDRNSVKISIKSISKKLSNDELKVELKRISEKLSDLKEKKRNQVNIALDKRDQLDELQFKLEETRQSNRKNELKKKIEQLEVELEKEEQKVRNLQLEINKLEKIKKRL
jgi:hypothetical protein